MYQLRLKTGQERKIFKMKPFKVNALKNLKCINFNSIMQVNNTSLMYKNLHVEDSNVEKINFDFCNKVSQRITRNGFKRF